MKYRFLFLSSLVCICTVVAHASDFTADDESVEYIGMEYDDEYSPDEYVTTTEEISTEISVEPETPATKKSNDITQDIYLDSLDDVTLINLYNTTMDDVAKTRARIETLLMPNRPSDNIWVTDCPYSDENNSWGAAAQSSYQIDIDMGTDGCPFETMAECKIWRRKPIIRETVAPRSPKIRFEKMDDMMAEIECTGGLDANSPAAAPLVNRYKSLMKSARACCTEGITYSLRNAGASDGLVYKFLVDDANFYNVGDRCLMMTDSEIESETYMDATSDMITDVRNGCLCRSRNWFKSLLAPFVDAWRKSPEFAESPFYWTYTDGVGREVTVSINDDVQHVIDTLATCP